MTMDERLSYFHELINCSYPVDLWVYSPDFKLVRSTCPPDQEVPEMFPLMQFPPALSEYLRTGSRFPFILDAALGLIYVFVFEYENEPENKTASGSTDTGNCTKNSVAGTLRYIHMMGPVFNGKNTHLILRKELSRRNLSIELQKKVLEQLEKVPIIPTTQFYQYAVMFHYAVTGEHISTSDICFPDTEDSDAFSEIRLISEEHRGVWIAEQRMLQMFREGNPDFKKALAHSCSLSSGVKFDVGDSLRKAKNSALVLLTLLSRAAIEGGVDSSISYTLNDYYAQKIEECRTVSESSSVTNEMMDDYFQRVQEAKEKASLSKEIRYICDYISSHPDEKLSIADLAGRAGYTEYYFSHKFKSEVGMSVNEYIRSKKIELAKLWLSATQKSIQEISSDLGFGSRSYFSSSFREATGMSPKEYRESS